MDKVGKRTLASALVRYLVPCIIVCAVGALVIEGLTVYLGKWTLSVYEDSGPYERDYIGDKFYMISQLMFCLRIVLVPIWAAACLWVTAHVFLRSEIQSPVDTLIKASDKIRNDELDFTVECPTDNELGRLCGSFEDMRRNLYDSNYTLWKALEERKRLNSAFAHDLRTPITVLCGYAELIDKCGGKLPPEKQAEIMTKMAAQVERLKSYTEKMSGVNKLEDIIPDVKPVRFDELCRHISESGELLCGERFSFTAVGDGESLVNTDAELLMEVFLNLAANATHYAKTVVDCRAELRGSSLRLVVTDDGCGFSEDAMRQAWKPFYRDESEEDKTHFGLGLYICWLLCRKLGGGITIENAPSGGGMVTAEVNTSASA